MYVEFGGVKEGHFRRNIWVDNFEELNRLKQEFGNTDVYITVWSYDQPDSNSKLSAPLYFDLDNKDLDVALQDTISLCDILLRQYNIPYECMAIRFSGSGGFHVVIDENVFRLPNGVNRVDLWKYIASKLGKYIPSLDMKVYEKRRLLRLTGSVNSKTGLYKIPVNYDELHEGIDYIKEHAKKTRDMTEIVPYFIPDTQKKMLDVWNEMPRKSYEKPPCIKNIEKGIGKGERNNALFLLALYYKKCKKGRSEIFKTLADWNKKNDPEISLSEIGTTLNSVMRGEYSIGCGSSELQNYCDKEHCNIRRY